MSFRCLAISRVVLPAQRKILSPGCTSFAASAAILCRASTLLEFVSVGSKVLPLPFFSGSETLVAPPRTKLILPRLQSSVKSRRIVGFETPM